MEYQHSAGIIVFRQEGSQRTYLLLHYASGHWDFPKGKIEKGETKKQAALRELLEETNIDGVIFIPGFEHVLSYVFTGRDGRKIHKTVTFFLGRTQQESVTVSYEHKGFAWLPFEQAYERVTYANAREILEKAELFLSM